MTLLDRARAKFEPVSPKPMETMLYAVIGGFGLAFLIVMLRGFSDRRIRDPEEVPGLLGTNVVGVFPQLAGSQARTRIGRIVEEQPASLAAESIRSVRTAVTFALPNNGKGVICVTSSVSGEGKSTSASNLAYALAHAGRKTLLIDADLRKPGQHEIYGVGGAVGFGNVISGSASYRKAIDQNVAAGLDLLPAGDASGKAAELLESEDCREALERLRQEYDCIVLDSSPVLETAEARVLSSRADVTIFVMRLDVSTAPNAKRATGILRSVEANLLGVLLNGSKTKKGSKAYAEGISYGYAYGGARGLQPAGSDVRVAATDVKGDKGLEAWS